MEKYPRNLWLVAGCDRIFARAKMRATHLSTRVGAIAEELSLLGAHLSELERMLKKGRPVGKRLDFLLRELNREANTLSSKSVSVEIPANRWKLNVHDRLDLKAGAKIIFLKNKKRLFAF